MADADWFPPITLTRKAAVALWLVYFGLLMTAALLPLHFGVHGTRLWPALATAAVAASLMLVLMRAPRLLEQRGAPPRLLMFVRGSLGVVPLLGVMVVQAVAQGSIWAGVRSYGVMIPVFLGMGVISAGMLNRAGSTRHCPSCDYEFGFENEAGAPSRCPECGTPWLGRLVTGRRMRSPMLITVGGVICVAPYVLMFVGLGTGVARWLPTGVLLTWVSASKFNDAPMQELAARTLSADQAADLAERLLNRRRESAPIPIGVEAKEWLEAQVAAGALPEPLRERYFAEMFTGRLAAPSRVKAGEPFRVALRDTRAWDGYSHKCIVYIAGFGVGDGPAEAGRSTEGYYPILIDSARHSRGAAGEIPGATLTIAEPGKHRVRAEVWVVVLTGFPKPVTWNDDGTPNLPATALWSKKVVLEGDVVVTP